MTTCSVTRAFDISCRHHYSPVYCSFTRNIRVSSFICSRICQRFQAFIACSRISGKVFHNGVSALFEVKMLENRKTVIVRYMAIGTGLE
jgi:hypothetical protein